MPTSLPVTIRVLGTRLVSLVIMGQNVIATFEGGSGAWVADGEEGLSEVDHVEEISACAFYPGLSPERFGAMEARLHRWHEQGTLLSVVGNEVFIAVFEPPSPGQPVTEVVGFPGSGGLYQHPEDEIPGF